MRNKGLVSVIIPSYRRCETVTRAIDSALAQTYGPIEICLVDDNDPGDEYSLALLKALEKYAGDNRVRYIGQKKHINGAVARNVGIQAATGEYIGFLDDDDEWLPEKIEKQMQVLLGDPTADAVTVLWKLYRDNKEIRICPPYSSVDLQFKVFSREVAAYTSTVLIKKSAIDEFGGFDHNLLRHQDLQFLINALNDSKFKVISEYLVKLHADSEINRPNVEKLIDAKRAFFESVKKEYKKFDKVDQIRIKNAHCYEIAFQALKAEKYGVALRYVCQAGINYSSFKDLTVRLKERNLSRGGVNREPLLNENTLRIDTVCYDWRLPEGGAAA